MKRQTGALTLKLGMAVAGVGSLAAVGVLVAQLPDFPDTAKFSQQTHLFVPGGYAVGPLVPSPLPSPSAARLAKPANSPKAATTHAAAKKHRAVPVAAAVNMTPTPAPPSVHAVVVSGLPRTSTPTPTPTPLKRSPAQLPPWWQWFTKDAPHDPGHGPGSDRNHAPKPPLRQPQPPPKAAPSPKPGPLGDNAWCSDSACEGDGSPGHHHHEPHGHN